MSEHTKTPWTMEDDEDSDLINIGHIDDRGIMPDAVCRLHDEANARHIVHCVNNHERLFEALRNLTRACNNELLSEERHWIIDQLDDARALLAVLEAEKGGEL